MILFYKTNEEKKELLGLSDDEYNLIGSEFISRIVYKTDNSRYTLDNSHYQHVSTFLINHHLNDDEYFIFHKVESYNMISGNIIEFEHFATFFPEIYITENRNRIIDGIIESE